MPTAAFVSTYSPRMCGIGTFTADLCDNLPRRWDSIVVAVNETGGTYTYPNRVRFQISRDEWCSYVEAADFLNETGVDVVCIQHEYGLFGGAAGSYLLALLNRLSLPAVTTVHTVLRYPNSSQRLVLAALIDRSDKVIVLSDHGVRFLVDVYGGSRERIAMIPHGVPDLPRCVASRRGSNFAFDEQFILLTAGLLSPNKGIENVILALPEILAVNPRVTYVVAGITHPMIQKVYGEAYRDGLRDLARKCQVEHRVVFIDRYLEHHEMCALFARADLYVAAHSQIEQIVSGTVAFALAASKAIVATPFWYAQDLLANGAGILIPFSNPHAIATQVLDLSFDDARRRQLESYAYAASRQMCWPEVAASYATTFDTAVRESRGQTGRLPDEYLLAQPICLDHVQTLTDDTGMLQHALCTVPNRFEGYSTDDNARALMVAIAIDDLGNANGQLPYALASTYLSFLWHAFNPDTNRFRNFLSYDRSWLEAIGSEECHGRALWALSTTLRNTRHNGLRDISAELIGRALPAVPSFRSIRSRSFALLALAEYLQVRPDEDAATRIRSCLCTELLLAYEHHSSPDWQWFEDELTYFNARVPEALLVTGAAMQRSEIVATALSALRWLCKMQVSRTGYFSPIGNDGFYPRGGARACFDQQPVEAHATISACVCAYRITGQEQWLDDAKSAFHWFLGFNDVGLPLYDATTGGCRDGLHADGVNHNEGAESTLAYIASALALRSVLPDSSPRGSRSSAAPAPEPA